MKIFEKTTFGDDELIGERSDLQIASFKSTSGGERLVCTLGDAEIVLIASFVEEE